jgi:hypothetical protein
MTKIAGSADPDPPQNVMDPQHCLCHYWGKKLAIGSVADPEGFSRIPDTGSRFRIPYTDPHQGIKVFLTQKIVSKLWEI